MGRYERLSFRAQSARNLRRRDPSPSAQDDIFSQLLEMNIRKKLRGERGQTATEFLFILVAIVFVILFHTQLSLSHIVTSYFRYASFMTARAEAVNPEAGGVYIEELVGTPTESRLRPAAMLLSSEGGAAVRRGETNDVTLEYEVLTYIPLTGGLAEALSRRTSRSPFVDEPPRQENEEFFDNE